LNNYGLVNWDDEVKRGQPIEILQVENTDRSGTHTYSIRVLHEFGKGSGYLNPQKIQEIWKHAKEFEVLFSDHTRGRFEVFMDVLLNPASVWLEIFRLSDEQSIGLIVLTHVLPHFDAHGHFTFWDSIAGGRQGLVLQVAKILFKVYDLRRMSAQVPKYQPGVIRFVKKLGFKEEGEKREAVLYKGEWVPAILLGLLESELREALHG